VQRQHYTYLLTRALPEGGCRYYVGIRTCPKGETPATDTRYLGSGKAIRAAVKKHRREFSKTILGVFDTRKEAAALERALVGLATANSPWSYNLQAGGEDGGLKTEATRAKIARARRAYWSDPKRAVSKAEGMRRARERQAASEERAEAVRRVVDAERKRRGLRGHLPRPRKSKASARGSGTRAYWASMTPEERSAEMKRRAAVARENRNKKKHQ